MLNFQKLQPRQRRLWGIMPLVYVIGLGVFVMCQARVVGKVDVGPPNFLFGFWLVPHEKLQVVAKAGFNTVLYIAGWAETKDERFLKVDQDKLKIVQTYLDEAHRCGVKVIVGLNYLVGAPGWEKKPLSVVDLSEPMKVVMAVKEHPALLAWYPIDEPEARDVSQAFVQRVCEELRSRDQAHPILVSFHTPHRAPQKLMAYEGFLDWVGFHCYPVTRENPGVLPVIQNADVAFQISKGRPLIATLQFFWDKWRRMPTIDELRTMTYLAIVRGASGVLFFRWWSPKNMPSLGAPTPKHPDALDLETAYPELWQGLGTLAREINSLQHMFAASSVRHPLQVDPPEVHAALYAANNMEMALIVNASCQPAKAIIKGFPSLARKVRKFPSGQEIDITQGAFATALAPHDVLFYKVISNH